MNNRTFSQKPAIEVLAVFCFFVGVFGGIILANQNGGELAAALEMPGGMTSWFGLLGKRCLFAGALWLLGMSLPAIPGTLCVIGWLGFSMSFLISSYTIRCGLGGLPVFLASVFPQILFYLPVWAVLITWALCGQQRLHLAGFAVLLVLTALGALTETALNPGLTALVWNWFS